MKQNPKVVTFDRSPAYVHHRAMVNRRENNPVDALELMRQAVERSPENREYRLDLAELYCEMGCHEQSSQLLLDMLAQKDAPAECYYGLALNQMGLNDLEGARRSLRLYRRADPGGARANGVGQLTSELEIYNAMNRPVSRRLYRAMRIAQRACDQMRIGALEEARRLFERSLLLASEQYEMRALYAMTLMMLGENEAALQEAERALEGFPPSVRAICIGAQVIYALGDSPRAADALRRVLAERPDGAELQMLIYALSTMDMDAEIDECARLALQEAPFDRRLLHVRATALHRLGKPDQQVERFWQRILRIDPEDSVARFYQEAASQHALDRMPPEYAYEVPHEEFVRRFHWLAERVSADLSEVQKTWDEDEEFRRMIRWAAWSEDERLRRVAMTVIAAMDDDAAQSMVRQMLFGSDLSAESKIHIAAILKMRGVDMRSMMPNDGDMDSVILPDAEPLMEEFLVGERQLIRYAAEVLEDDYDISALPALAMMWAIYRKYRGLRTDPIICTEAGAAALTYAYLMRHGKKEALGKVARRFGCSVRKLVYYAGRILETLENYEGETKDEDS